MEPETATQPQAAVQPQNSPQQSQSQGSSFSPSTIALTKAIGMAESGGKYNSGDNTGDNANSSGAYQFTPGFLQEWAPKAGVQYQPGTSLTPQQQDEIAATAVQTMSTSGDPAYASLGKLTPAQIASAWNTGDPNAYLDPGYGQNNTYGSTENYVNKVAQYYDQETGSTSAVPPTSTSQSSSGGSGILASLAGLGIGGLSWLAGEAAKPIQDAATDAVAGAAAGSVLPGEGTVAGGVAGAVGGTVEGIVQDIAGGGGQQPPTSTDISASSSSQPQEPDLTQEGNQVDPNKIPQESAPNPQTQQQVQASQTAQNAIQETMQGTQSNRNFAASQPGQEAIQAAASFGLVNPDENGNLTFDEEKRKQLEGTIEEGRDGIIASQGTTASPVSVANYAGNFIGKDRLNTQDDRNKAAQIVQREIGADSGGIPMNGQMSLAKMREAQKTHYKAAQQSYLNPKPSADLLAHKALGNAYGRAIREKIKQEDLPLYDRLTKMSSTLTNVKSLKKRIEGKKAPKNSAIWKSILKSGAKYAEIYIGDKLGGPIGAVLGSMAGEHINGIIDRKYGKTIFETKGMKAAMDVLNKTKPEVYTKLVDELEKHGVNIPKDETKKPETQSGLIKLVKKDESKFKGHKGLVDLPNKKKEEPSGAQKGEHEIGKDEILKNGKTIRFDMKTGKRYVRD